jgi:hypothetical protein
MQKRVNIDVNISFNNFDKYKLKIVFLLEIYLKAILNLRCYKQATTIAQTLSKIFIAKSSQRILKLACFAIMQLLFYNKQYISLQIYIR